MLLSATGCVYYNLFYNTKRTYQAAEQIPLQPDGEVNRVALDGYTQVIEKCTKLINENPDSKYVDDALLLMAKAHYQRREYAEAVDALDRLQSEYPESELLEDAQLYAAKSLLGRGSEADAVDKLKTIITENSRSPHAPEILYLLGTNLIKLDRDDEAFAYLKQLADDYPNTTYRLNADLEIATVFTESGQYDRALATLEGLGNRKLDEVDSIRYYMALAELRIKMGDYEAALQAITALDEEVLGHHMRAVQLLKKSTVYTGLDSISLAIDGYQSVVARYPRSNYSAEASFQLGVIFQENLDSLDVAKTHFDNVPRQFPRSEFAEDAIQRSVSITKLQRLQSSLQGGDAENSAMVKFELAETQLFQFKDYEKALVAYNVVLDEYPNSDVAPKAAYAISYIYSEVLEDVDRARLAYQRVIDNYPDSQQAEYARTYLQGHAAQLESRNE